MNSFSNVPRVDVFCVRCKELKRPCVWIMKANGYTEENYVCNSCRVKEPAPPLRIGSLGVVTEDQS